MTIANKFIYSFPDDKVYLERHDGYSLHILIKYENDKFWYKYYTNLNTWNEHWFRFALAWYDDTYNFAKYLETNTHPLEDIVLSYDSYK